ncbi:MAG: acyl carrier protein [Oscillospiraceae bacterium]|nr:acyl carrier protein [Oscillospiraceae bacterium]
MIFEQLKEIILDQMDIDEDCITMEADFVDDLHADSLDITLLMKTISDEFDIAFEDEAVDQINTIGDAVQYIQAYIKE